MEIKKNQIWDYSLIPPKQWTWHFTENHWMDLYIDPAGLKYFGTTWDCQSGGGYTGGFQTFDQFIAEGPIQNMPDEMSKEVTNYLLENRKEGGSSLTLALKLAKPFVLKEAYIQLNSTPIIIKHFSPNLDPESNIDQKDFTFYEGSIITGQHLIEYLFVVLDENNNAWKFKDTRKITIGEDNLICMIKIKPDKDTPLCDMHLSVK